MPEQGPKEAKTTLWTRVWAWVERRSGWLLAAMQVLFFVVFSLAAIRKYELWRMGYDVSLIHQAIWNTVHGRFLETHAYDFTNSLLGTDSFFMAAWMAPFYALVPSVYTLFAVQMAIVSLGALPLYGVAKDRLGGAAGLAIAAVYFLYLPVEYGSLYEIRFRIMAMAWLGFLFLYVERRKYWALWPFILLALSCRLDTTIAVFMLGFYALLRRRPWYYGATLIAAGLGWYLVMTQTIMPALSTREGYMFLEHYAHLGSTPAEVLLAPVTRPLVVLQTVLTPQKLRYLWQMGAPLLFLPVVGLPAFLPALPLLALNLLSTRPNQFDIYHHYQGMVTPFLMVGVVLAWDWLTRVRAPGVLAGFLPRRTPRARGEKEGAAAGAVKDQKGAAPSAASAFSLGWWRLDRTVRLRILILAVLAASLVANLGWRNPLPSIIFGHTPARAAAARALIARIPPDVPVAASNLLAPMIPVRRDIFLVPGGDFYYAAHPEERADYILLDLQSERGEEEAALLEVLRGRPEWRVLEERDGYVLLARGAEGP